MTCLFSTCPDFVILKGRRVNRYLRSRNVTFVNSLLGLSLYRFCCVDVGLVGLTVDFFQSKVKKAFLISREKGICGILLRNVSQKTWNEKVSFVEKSFSSRHTRKTRKKFGDFFLWNDLVKSFSSLAVWFSLTGSFQAGIQCKAPNDKMNKDNFPTRAVVITLTYVFWLCGQHGLLIT